jgi:hypothetical protein
LECDTRLHGIVVHHVKIRSYHKSYHNTRKRKILPLALNPNRKNKNTNTKALIVQEEGRGGEDQERTSQGSSKKKLDDLIILLIKITCS